MKICDCDAGLHVFRMASISAPQFVPSPLLEVDGGIMRLAMGARPMAAVAILTRQTLVATKLRPFPKWRWRAQCSKIHSGEAMDGSSCGLPRSDRPCGFTIAEQQAAIHFQLSKLGRSIYICFAASSVVP